MNRKEKNINQILKKLNVKLKRINARLKFSKYFLLKLIFWFIVFSIVASVSIILFLYSKGIINANINETFSDTMFSTGLNLIFSIIGFFIALIIFLIQYVGKKYNSEELDKFFISRKYFIITLALLFVYIIFNFFALYLQLKYPYTLISFIFSISVVALIITTIFFTFFYINLSNTLTHISNQIIQFIKKKKSFIKLPIINCETSYTETFINSLNKKIELFFTAGAEAINKNQTNVLKASLKCLYKITKNYLEQSKHVQATEDQFLSELNDQFNFIISEALTNRNQKILEDIATIIGDISLDIIEYRKGIGDIHNFALNWLATLQNLFEKSYGKDRTIVCYLCLEKINAVVLMSLKKGYYNSYDTYNMFIDEISTKLSMSNTYWSAILLQRALLMYQHQFLKFLQLSKEGKIAFNEAFIKHFFDKIVKIINESKNIHGSFRNKTVLFASLYGLESFAQKIALIRLDNLRNEKIKRNVAVYIKQFIDFNKKIIETNSEKNDNRVYASFSETLFLITKRIDLTDDDRKSLIEILSNSLLEFVKNKYVAAVDKHDNNFYELKEITIDYFALLIYLYNDEPDMINKVIQQFVDIYHIIKKKITSQNKQYLIKSLYKELKLFSCWINTFSDLKEINKPIIKILKKDFYEPSFPHRVSIPSLFETYGYQESSISRWSSRWYLHPSYMWGNRFQEEISNELNGSGDRKYIDFHEMLKN